MGSIKARDIISSVKQAILLSDKERTISNAVVDENRYALYIDTINKATVFFKHRGKVTYDSPNQKYSYHGVVIDLINDEFEGKSITTFTEIINAFDSMELIGNTEGKIKIVLIFDGIYKAK